MQRALFDRLVDRPSSFARDDERGVPVRPLMLRRRRLEWSVVFLRFSQRVAQRRDVGAESSSGNSRRDFLEQPVIAVWIAERNERLTIRVAPRHRTWLSRREMEHAAHLNAVTKKFRSRCFDV